MSLVLLSESSAVPLASRVEVAMSRRARRRGLLGRQRIDGDAAMMLVPCAAVHTAFMRFPIDVVFINRDGRVVHIASRLQPWRVAMSPAAHAVIELAAGTLDRRDVRVGDRLRLVDVGRGAREFDEIAFEKVAQCLEARAS
jgi:uncharacterized membrane protein (UPF0127 family)